MPLRMLTGATGSGKTTALHQQYHDWVRSEVRSDQILVLTAGAGAAAAFREAIDLPASGPLEVYPFFAFVQRELNLYWSLAQAAVPELRRWLRPVYLDAAVTQLLMQQNLEPLLALFGEALKAPPRRIAGQVASQIAGVGAEGGLGPGEIAARLAAADRPERAPLYQSLQGLLEAHQTRCLQAGLLDYALALRLYTGALLPDPTYQGDLRARYRRLLVDDLDEATEAEQAFVEAMAGQVEEALVALDPEGGHASFRGADAARAAARFAPQAEGRALPGSRTCTDAAARLGDALAAQIRGESPCPKGRLKDVVEARIMTDLRSDLHLRVAEAAAALVDRGIPAGQIAILAPVPEKGLEAALRRRLPVQSLLPARRLVDEPAVRAIIALAGLASPRWRFPGLSPGWLAGAAQYLLGLDAIRAATLGEALWRAGEELPEAPGEAYRLLRTWVEEARGQEWQADRLVQAALFEVVAPLRIGLGAGGDRPGLDPEAVRACRQYLARVRHFQEAAGRLGPDGLGAAYVPLLTEASLPLEPEPYDPAQAAVLLASPYAYLSRRITSQYQIWVDIAGPGWYPSDAKELANPHVLAPAWPEGERWTDRHAEATRRAAAARTARALLRRCTGRLILAECVLGVWGHEQEGGLSDAFTLLEGTEGRWSR